MKQPFVLAGGASAHIFDGTLIQKGNFCIVYRIGVEAFAGAELKIISEEFSRMLTPRDHIASIDVVVGRHLYIEAVGKGEVSGFYQALGTSG